MVKKILIKNYDLGFFTETPITVQRFQVEDNEKELVWCNHAGAKEEVETRDYWNPITSNHTQLDERVLYCNKCEAIKVIDDDYFDWQNTPIEGEY